jgi:hypothetical protein
VNILPREKQIEAVAVLTEGVSVRAAERLTGVKRELQHWNERSELMATRKQCIEKMEARFTKPASGIDEEPMIFRSPALYAR